MVDWGCRAFTVGMLGYTTQSEQSRPASEMNCSNRLMPHWFGGDDILEKRRVLSIDGPLCRRSRFDRIKAPACEKRKKRQRVKAPAGLQRQLEKKDSASCTKALASKRQL